MRSMTGFGRGTASSRGDQVTVEISAVNSRKQLDLRLSLPREFAAVEASFRKRLQNDVSRGSLSVTVTCELSPESRKARIRFDADAAAATAAELKKLAAATGIRDEVRAADLLLIPGIVVEEPVPITDELRALAEEALSGALGELITMQETEGASLRLDLVERLREVEEAVAEIQGQSDQVLVHFRDRLRERIQLLDVDVPVDDERLAKELAFYAERSDVAEELVRLESHVQQFKELLDGDEPAGRAMEFLCQEMGREINTLCSKTCDTGVSRLGLQLKGELARIREQIQNIV